MAGFALGGCAGSGLGLWGCGAAFTLQGNQSLLTSIRFPDFGAAGSKQRDGLRGVWGGCSAGSGSTACQNIPAKIKQSMSTTRTAGKGNGG